jgi:hypothetical protein
MIGIAAMLTPEHWRKRAQEARVDADRHADPDIKKALLEIAALYELLVVPTDKRPVI